MIRIDNIGDACVETLKTVSYNQGSFVIQFSVNSEDYYLDINIEYKTIEDDEHCELILQQIKFSNALDTFCEGSVSDSELEELLMNQINIEFNNENIEDKNELISVITKNIKKFIKAAESEMY